jgi:hypothetical protein
MRTLLAIVLIWIAGALPVRAAAPVAIAPYLITGEGAITIGVTVDGQGPYPFIIDTGATLTLVFENFAKARAPARAEGPSFRILSISGVKVFDPYVIGDIAAGAVLARRQTGVILPDWEAPRETPAGVIGLDILENFALAFDVDARTIAFYPKGALPAELTGKMRKTPMKRTRYEGAGAELFTVRGRVNGEPITFILDLGLATTLVNYAAGEALFSGRLFVAAGRTARTGTRLDDVFDDRTRVSSGVMRTITVGTQRWSRPVVWIYDAPLFDELGVQRLAYGLLGADLLMRKDFAIDFASGRLYLGR